MDKQELQSISYWEQMGTRVYKLPKYVYIIPCINKYDMCKLPWHNTAGYIKKRSDGRWNWFIIPLSNCLGADLSNELWTVNKHIQGVSITMDEAKQAVLKGWEY